MDRTSEYGSDDAGSSPARGTNKRNKIMRINTLQDIWDNLGYIIQKHNNYKVVNENRDMLVYNCSPTKMKDGSVKDTFIEVGYLYLMSAVKNDSQGFIWFDCRNKINFDREHKIYSERIPEMISDKIVGRFNTKIAQIYNDETKEFLHKDSNIRWDTLVGQALFTTREEADEYIEQCKEGKVEIKSFYLKIETPEVIYGNIENRR